MTLQQLTVAMYSQTQAARLASQVTARAQSETFVKEAPVQKLAPAESEARLRTIMASVTKDLLSMETN